MKLAEFIIPGLVVLAVAIIFVARRKSSPPFDVGGIYSINDGTGRYGVVKLLAQADGICHVRLYRQRFSTRPATIDVASLSLGKFGDPDGFGIGHVPLYKDGLFGWDPC